jgi:cellulose synthase/poly-beta-1,6-N-acetylglucosamine synthase-like glycosyltransferase/peptidoglycan/xylan/chitin deacetylase (PgdA/CDA1 family)/spore germination protein YaaH
MLGVVVFGSAALFVRSILQPPTMLAELAPVVAQSRASATPAPPAADSKAIVAAFYAPWEEAGLNSFRNHADQLSHVMPEWMHLGADGASFDAEPEDPRQLSRDLDLLRLARQHRVAVQPVLNNNVAAGFDPARLHELLVSPEKQQVLARLLRDWLLDRQCDGLNLDLENFAPGDEARLPEFVEILAAVLHPAGLRLSVDLESQYTDPAWLKRIAAASDFVILMAYDEHAEDDEPGPIASERWFEKVIADVAAVLPREKFVAGLGNYAYDWTAGRPPAESISTHLALVRATTYAAGRAPAATVIFDEISRNPTFTYADEAGAQHEVWFLDAVTASNQWQIARKAGAAGGALWLLGSEDEGVWSFLDRRLPAAPPISTAMQRVRMQVDFDYTGDGEILSIASEPRDGWRDLTVDPRTGRYRREEYRSLASPLVVRRSDHAERTLAITFDDGPDPRFTPQILDVLDRLKAPATFFVVGAQAAQHSALIQRIWDRGDDLGNHTFSHPNMESVPEYRARVEINATQRVLEGTIGHSTMLFRPPFRVDAVVESVEAARTLVFASHAGCVTVAALIDAHDWDPWKPAPPGALPVLRPPEELAAEIIQQTHETQGNVILLHDGGGNRTATVRALEIFIPALRAQGYRFVTVSQLMGRERTAVMPATPANQGPMVQLNRTFLGTVSGFLSSLHWLFQCAIALGIARVVIVTGLALIARWRQRRLSFPANYQPAVSVLIPAYNESKVINRTIRSVLRSEFPVLEILVIDDGSRDGTADCVDAEFSDELLVRVIRQENAGKPAALNRGIEEACGDILVCADADTQFAPDAVGLLVRHFADASVGAVAGNVKVGNRVNLLTRWQSLEYITSQNLDRLAYSLGDAITVVPGAIGAWRRRALSDAGGYVADTHAEDMDLSWRLHRTGWAIRTETGALAHTEAPETLGAFFKQRFRWIFGTLQCLWKHRGALGRGGWFGWVVLPSLWIFNVGFQLIAPLVDLQVLIAIATAAYGWVQEHFHHDDWQPNFVSAEFLGVTVGSFVLFFVIDFAAALLALRFDREPLGTARGLFWQRFAYRQMMYFVLFRALTKVMFGTRMRWGKLARTGSTDESIAAPLRDPLRTPSASLDLGAPAEPAS